MQECYQAHENFHNYGDDNYVSDEVPVCSRAEAVINIEDPMILGMLILMMTQRVWLRMTGT